MISEGNKVFVRVHATADNMDTIFGHYFESSDEGKTIVTILCDKSDKYNSKLFNKKFLQEKGLPIPGWI